MNNLSEIKTQYKKLLDDKSISNYRIQKDTGVSYGNISELRNKKTIEELNLGNSRKTI